MELFRTISPNAGSLSSVETKVGVASRDHSVVTPHPPVSRDRALLARPGGVRPGPLPGGADDASTTTRRRHRQAGLARCPFPPAPFKLNDGRQAEVTNSAFGAVYSVVDGTAHPLCDAAGYAPFGFGYRRCGGEQLHRRVPQGVPANGLEDNGVEFVRLDLDNPSGLPVSPRSLIDDDIGFHRPA